MAKKKRKCRNIQINPEDGIENAVLLLARFDYEDALLEQMENRDNKNANRKVRRLEKFFLSEWGQLLSFNCGELIIEKCRWNVLKGGAAQ